MTWLAACAGLVPFVVHGSMPALIAVRQWRFSRLECRYLPKRLAPEREWSRDTRHAIRLGVQDDVLFALGLYTRWMVATATPVSIGGAAGALALRAPGSPAVSAVTASVLASLGVTAWLIVTSHQRLISSATAPRIPRRQKSDDPRPSRWRQDAAEALDAKMTRIRRAVLPQAQRDHACAAVLQDVARLDPATLLARVTTVLQQAEHDGVRSAAHPPTSSLSTATARVAAQAELAVTARQNAGTSPGEICPEALFHYEAVLRIAYDHGGPTALCDVTRTPLTTVDLTHAPTTSTTPRPDAAPRDHAARGQVA